MELPPFAYLPGQTKRHADAEFEYLRRSVRPGMTAEELIQTAAWKAGLWFLECGYFWEAHEVLEPIWLQTRPESTERHKVQAIIQIANAGLKRRMQRPNAVVRLCDIAEAHLAACDPDPDIMGVPAEGMFGKIAELRDQANLQRRECE